MDMLLLKNSKVHPKKVNMSTLAILGASGHGKVIAEAALLSGWDDIVFYDDNYPNIVQNEIWPIVGTSNDLCLNTSMVDGVVIGIGNNYIRKIKSDLIIKARLKLVSIIHPQATVSSFSKVGVGSVIFAGAVVNPFAVLGESTIINTNSIVEHDCRIGNFTHLSPGARIAGGVEIQELSWLGIGSSVIELVKIGSEIIIGAGSVVIKNLEQPGTYIGVPVKRLEKLKC